MANRYLSSEIRFWLKVDKFGPEHPTLGRCWTWAGCLKEGYGIFKAGNRQVSVTRHSYRHYVSDFPDDLCILHRCDNPLCVNPCHLFLGTRPDNSADMVEKDRQLKGEEQPRAKITEEQAKEIIVRHRRGLTKLLAIEFGISVHQVRRIAKGTSWKHLHRCQQLIEAVRGIG